MKILILRFSALGDVAMTVPVIASLAQQYPQCEIMVASRAGFADLFAEMPENVRFFGVDLKGKYKGFAGLNALYKDLKVQNFDFVADFHNVLRTKYLLFRFLLSGAKTAKINKGRAEKRALTRRYNKKFAPLKSSFERYKNVLEKLGFAFNCNFHSFFGKKIPNFDLISTFTNKKTEKWLGIAPFAAHEGKIYPLNKMEKVLAELSENKNLKIFIFGGGEREKQIAEMWQAKYQNVQSVVGQFSMYQELVLMHFCDTFLSMDSANMHLAALAGTKVLSIWGATHYFSGFNAWQQPVNNIIESDLLCRPCSVFGNKPCFHKDFACMQCIETDKIVEKIFNLLSF